MGSSTPHDSASPRPMNGKTQDVFQKIVNSRKSYKMMKGAAEAVWPPYLEETLLRGFESYEPEDCRETRLLGRFPMRNQYISDFIYRATGKRRTAKQVGSRLQQLRDTPEGKQLLNSLTQHYNLGGKPLGQRSSSSSASSVTDGSLSPTSPLSSSSSFPSGCSPSPDTSVRRTYVCIDLLPMDPHAPCSAYGTEHFHDASTPTDSIFSSNGETDIFRPSSRPRTICSIDPTITFVSQSVISAQSSCSVLLDGATVHHEVTPLTLAGPCPDSRRNVDCPLLYGVQLVPSYWRLLCQCPDLTRYTIVQRISRSTNSPPSHSGNEDSLMFSAVYHFSYPSINDDLTPSLSSTPLFGENNGTEYSPVDTQSNSWYSSSLSPMDMEALSDVPDTTGEYRSAKAKSTEECARSMPLALGNHMGTSKTSFIEGPSVLSPISSCFPMDLSNYIV